MKELAVLFPSPEITDSMQLLWFGERCSRSLSTRRDLSRFRPFHSIDDECFGSSFVLGKLFLHIIKCSLLFSLPFPSKRSWFRRGLLVYELEDVRVYRCL